MRQVLQLWLPYLLGRLGWLGGIGAVLLTAAIALQLVVLQPQAEDNRRLQAEWLALSQDAQARVAEARPNEALQDLAPTTMASEAIARLFAAADSAGLLLSQGEYRQVSEKGSGLSQYQITLPLTGSYPAVRAFLNEAMDREPGLALVGLKLSRASVTQSELDARLQLILYLREAG